MVVVLAPSEGPASCSGSTASWRTAFRTTDDLAALHIWPPGPATSSAWVPDWTHLRRLRFAPSAAGPEQLDELLCSERRRRVRDALTRLPTAMRDALLLRYGEELRYDEMAEVLDVREATLRSRVHHGLKALCKLLEKSP